MVINRFETQDRTNFVGRCDFVSNQLVYQVAHVTHSHEVELTTHIDDFLFLRPSSLSEELPIEFFGNRFRNWFYRSLIVVCNLIFACTTFKQRLCNVKLTLKLFSMVRNVLLMVVVVRSFK